MAGLEAYVAGVPGGLGAFADDPMGAATAAMESRRRAQVENGRAPAWMRDIGANIGNLADQTVSSFIPPALRDRLPSPEMVGNLVLGALPGSGDYMAARDALESSAASLSALGRGDYMGAGARGVDALAAGLGIMPFLPYLASIKGVKNPIRAYHGSPHDFDKFSLDKIGSGEGAQAYGHGLYFAENEGVARSYRDALSRNQGATIEGTVGPATRDMISRIAPGFSTPAEMAETLRYRLDSRPRGDIVAGGMRWDRRTAKRALDAIDSGRVNVLPPGRMYEVNIHADPERFLDWDKPIDPGSPLRGLIEEYGAIFPRTNEAKDAVIAARRPELTGEGVYRSLQRIAGDKPTATNSLLRDADIPGIKYLDQGSRMAGDGSRNYVVFDDKLIDILRKYGIMAPMAGLGALAASGQDDPNL